MSDHHRKTPRTCKTCGKAFDARIADVRRGQGHTCSRRCSGKRPRPQRTMDQASYPTSPISTRTSHPLPATLEPQIERQEP